MSVAGVPRLIGELGEVSSTWPEVVADDRVAVVVVRRLADHRHRRSGAVAGRCRRVAARAETGRCDERCDDEGEAVCGALHGFIERGRTTVCPPDLGRVGTRIVAASSRQVTCGA
jgi:hypothetical protein